MLRAGVAWLNRHAVVVLVLIVVGGFVMFGSYLRQRDADRRATCNTFRHVIVDDVLGPVRAARDTPQVRAYINGVDAKLRARCEQSA